MADLENQVDQLKAQTARLEQVIEHLMARPVEGAAAPLRLAAVNPSRDVGRLQDFDGQAYADAPTPAGGTAADVQVTVALPAGKPAIWRPLANRWELLREIHVAVPPCGVGIPARVGTKPGHAKCCIYRLVPIKPGDADYSAATAPDVRLEPVPQTTTTSTTAAPTSTSSTGSPTTTTTADPSDPKNCLREDVYNFTLNAVPPKLPPNEIYWPVFQDAYGRWFVDPPAVTTTTRNPKAPPTCGGGCKFTWDGSQWNKNSDTCVPTTTTSTTSTSPDPGTTTSTTRDPCLCPTTQSPTTTTPPPCHCVYPPRCGSTVGECWYGTCVSGPVQDVNNLACTTTTTGGPTSSTTSTSTSSCNCATTTTLGPDCGDGGGGGDPTGPGACQWVWVPGTGWVQTSGCNFWNGVQYSCASPGGSPPNPGSACSNGSYFTACVAPGGGGDQCSPVCGNPGSSDSSSVCVDFGGGNTKWVGGGCVANGCVPCGCFQQLPPGPCNCGATAWFPCAGDPVCLATTTTASPTTPPPGCGGTVNPACVSCYPTSSTTSSTTTTPQCAGECKFQWSGASWSQISGGCYGWGTCYCVTPGVAGHETCEVTWTNCGTTTSTSTTTTTSTSTTTTSSTTTSTTTTAPTTTSTSSTSTSTTTTAPTTTSTSSTTSTTTTTLPYACCAPSGACNTSLGCYQAWSVIENPDQICAHYGGSGLANCGGAFPYATLAICQAACTTTTAAPTSTSSTTTTS